MNISRESEVNLINILIDQDVISGKDLIDIKKKSTEGQKSQLDAIFELKLTDEDKILDLLVKEQSLEVVDLSILPVADEVKSVLPSNYINMNFIAPFKIENKVLHIAIPDSSKLSLMRNLKTITKMDIELHAAKISHISEFIDKLLKESETTIVINEKDEIGIIEILGVDQEKINYAIDRIKNLVFEPVIDEVYNVKVIKILDFGAVVEFVPGKEALLHVSEIAWERVNNVTDYLNIGDQIEIKYLGIDPRTKKSKISRKVLLEKKS